MFDSLIISSIRESIEVKQNILNNKELLENIEKAAKISIEALKNGKKILIFGNGGSAADAQHLAGEFVSRFRFDREPLAAIALNTNTSIITSIGNDYEYDMLFERQVNALANEGDIVWGISTSGSDNINRGFVAAHNKKAITIGFLGGTGGKCLQNSDVELLVPSFDTPRVQESQILIGHIICDYIEKTMFG